MPRHFRVAAVVTVLCAGTALQAQRPSDVVKWSVAPGTVTVSPASSESVALTARIQAGWHLYALTQPKGGPNPLKIVMAEGGPFSIDAAAIQAPKPQVITDPNFELETRQYDGTVTFTVPVSARKDARRGAHEATIEVTFQACGNGICLRPYTEKLPVRIAVIPPPMDPATRR